MQQSQDDKEVLSLRGNPDQTLVLPEDDLGHVC